MDNKTTFGVFEGTVILINLVCAKVFLSLPRLLIDTSGTAAWIQLIYVTIIAIIVISIILKLYQKFEGMDLLDVMNFLGGNILTTIIGVLFTSYLTITISIVIREYCENMKTVALEVSPLLFVMIFFVGASIIAIYKSIEAITRVHAVFVPIISIAFISILFLLYPNYDHHNIFPIMGNGFKAVFLKGILAISIYSPMIYMHLLPPFLKKYKNLKKVTYSALFTSALFILLDTFAILLAFPYPASRESFLPFYSLTRLIYLGRFFDRVESVFIVMWTLSGLMYISAAFFMIIHFFGKTFKLQYSKPIIAPFMVIVFIISFLPKNISEVITFESKFYTIFSWIITFIIPIILLAAANIKRNIAEKGGIRND